MNTLNDALKPCPFCGGKPEHVRKSLDERYGYAVSVAYQCKCGTSKSAIGETSKPGYADNSTVEQKAIAAWNTRATTPEFSAAQTVMTDAEIDSIWIATPECKDGNDFVLFARAIEAAVLSANAGKVDEDVLSDLAVTAFSKWQEKEGVKSVDQCKSFCAGYMYASADRIETTQQASDAGKV